MEINQKRPCDSEPAQRASSSAPESRLRRPSHSGGQALQRWALGGVGALGLGALFILSGCPANLEQPERFEGTGTGAGGTSSMAAPACVTAIFKKTCAGNVCHDKGTITNDLDLESAGVATRLINVSATHAGVDMDGGTTCMPAKYIDTSNPSASWLLAKLNNGFGTCGGAMPQIGTLTSTDKACITSYVQSLASSATPDGGATGGTTGSGGTAAATGGGGAAATTGGTNGTTGGGGATATTGGTGGSSGGSGGSVSGTGGA